MAENGIRTPNVPLGALIEVLGHADAGGGTRVLARASVSALADAVRDVVSGDPSGIASLRMELAALSNVVSGKQGAFDLPALRAALEAVIAAVDGKVSQSELTDLLQRIQRINAGLYPALRPGDNPTAFSGSYDKGNPDDLAPLSEVDYPLQVTGDGLGRDLFATRDIWERALHPVGGGELWRARWSYRRRANSSDPSNDSVQRFVFWHGSDRSPMSATEVGSEAPSIATGPRAFSQIIGSNLAIEGALKPPPGAAYFRIGIRAYGLEQRTTVTDLGAVEITDAFQLLLNLIPPDSVPALAQALSDEVDRATEADAANAAAIAEETRRAGAAERDIAEDLLDLSQTAAGLAGQPAFGIGALQSGGSPVSEAAYGPDGVFAEAVTGEGVFERAVSGQWSVDGIEGAFGIGSVRPGGAPVTAIQYDRAGVALAADDDRGAVDRLASGAWLLPDVSAPAFGIGALGADPASRVMDLTLDERGRVVRARCVGERDYLLDYVATAEAILRVEAPQRLAPLSGTGSRIALPAARLPLDIGDGAFLATGPVDIISAEPAVQGFSVQVPFDEAGRQRTLPGCPLSDAVTVKSLDGNTTYVLGTDYLIDPNRGVITGLAGLAGKTVAVTGASALQRVDVVAYDQGTRSTVVLQGTPTLVEPDLGRPVLGDGQVALFRILRTRGYWEAAPAHLFDGILRRDMQAEILAEIERSRRHLAPLVARARRGETLRIGWTGDSIHQQGEPNSPDWLAVNPNGRDRDSMFYFDRYTPEMQKLIRQYLKDDGQGTRLHIEESVAWAGVHRLRELGAQCITGNFAIGGTYSSADIVNGRKNILHPDRMAAVIDWKPDLFMLATGMNERGENFTGPNVAKILTPFLTNNIPCAVITPPLVNPYYDDGSNVAIAKTCAIELRVSRTLGCACVYTPFVQSDATRQISLREVGMQWGLHPALPELRPTRALHRMLYA